jgi:hypothetical protein
MKNDVTLEMLQHLNTELNFELDVSATPVCAGLIKHSSLNESVTGCATPEIPTEIEKLKSALSYLSPDVDRGQGKFFTAAGLPTKDYWLAGVWAIASLGWVSGKEIAKNWSMQSINRYTDKGFEKAWNDYKPNHPNPIGIGSLYKFVKDLGWQQVQISTQPSANRPYKLLTGNDLRAMPPIQWRLKGVFPHEGLAAIYGPSASGKSFVAIDFCAALAEGCPWFGIRTTQSEVNYVALEGESGLKNRVAAWELENQRQLPQSMRMVMQPFQITNPTDVNELAATVPYGSVVIVDTLNRAAPTSDENSSKEMGEILQACKWLQKQIGGLVLLVHHTGKDTTKGARGHSSFYAALDGAIEVEKSNDKRSWSIAKAKDGQDGKSFPFSLKLHNLGKDSDGDEITSCTIEQALPNIFIKPSPQGLKQQAAFKTIKGHISTLVNPPLGIAGSQSGVPCVKFEDAISYLAGTLATTAKNKRRNEAKRLLTGLQRSGHIDIGLDANLDSWCWIPT